MIRKYHVQTGNNLFSQELTLEVVNDFVCFYLFARNAINDKVIFLTFSIPIGIASIVFLLLFDNHIKCYTEQGEGALCNMHLYKYKYNLSI